jgi:hypothetical protein
MDDAKNKAKDAAIRQSRETISQMLRDGATTHRVADRLVKMNRGRFILWRSYCASILSCVCKIHLRFAKAVISEFAVD